MVLESLDTAMQERLFHLIDDIEQPGGVKVIVNHLKLLAGEREGGGDREDVGAVLCHYEGNRCESSTDRVARRSASFEKLHRHGAAIQDDVRA